MRPGQRVQGLLLAKHRHQATDIDRLTQGFKPLLTLDQTGNRHAAQGAPSCWISRFRPAMSWPATFWRALSPAAFARAASARVSAHSSATCGVPDALRGVLEKNPEAAVIHQGKLDTINNVSLSWSTASQKARPSDSFGQPCMCSCPTDSLHRAQGHDGHLELPLLGRHSRPGALCFPPLNLAGVTPDLPVLYRFLTLHGSCAALSFVPICYNVYMLQCASRACHH